MKIVQKGNRQTQVADERLQEMLDVGYTEVDPKSGKLIDPPDKEDSEEVKALKKELKDLKKERDELAKESKALKKELDELKAQLEAAGSSNEPPKPET